MTPVTAKPPHIGAQVRVCGIFATVHVAKSPHLWCRGHAEETAPFAIALMISSSIGDTSPMKLRGLLLASTFLSPVLACGGDGDSGDGHDVIRFTLNWAQSQSEDPFIGTASIEVQLSYSTCVNQFYLETDTDYQFNGIEGEQVVLDWVKNDRVCDEERFPGAVQCEVSGVSQAFTAPQSPETTPGFFRMTLDVLDDKLTGRTVAVGPLPGSRITDASCDGNPTVTINKDTVKGFDAEGVQLWEISTFDYTDFKVGQTGVPGVRVRSLL